MEQKRKRGNPNWHKGMKSPNPHGIGLCNMKLNALFTRAFEKDKEKNGEDLFEYAFKRARTDSRVLVALINKFVPDLVKGEGFGGDKYIFVVRDKAPAERSNNRIQVHTAPEPAKD